MNKNIQAITDLIIARSKTTRAVYLNNINQAGSDTVNRAKLSCGNLAHGLAASDATSKLRLRSITDSNIAIISAYNDLLSAHQPYKNYPDLIKTAVHETGGIAQFAGGVPAMCDGITQGQPGMDLSLMSRDVIAMATGITLSHNMFDGVLMLGICDKIVPGLLIGALTFGHLPTVFIPAGPMPSGLPNKEKAAVRNQFAEGKVDQDALLDAELKSYHSPGTCTFYGTANSNQLVLEMMGLHLPGASFINPNTPLRDELTKAAARQVTRLTKQSGNYQPIASIVDEKCLVNAIIGLLATGGSTNLTLHLIAIARSAGIIINWTDFSELSKQVPLLTKIYPNGFADINHFQQAGGMAVLFKELLEHGLLHNDVNTICGKSLEKYIESPALVNNKLLWQNNITSSSDPEVLASVANPYRSHGGLQVLKGNLGQSVIKTSALADENFSLSAPAITFSDQHDLGAAFENGSLNKDCIIVIRFQGPKARGMPELHKLTPILSILQDQGYKVALVTDGRMSGASGNVPAAIQLCPEALDGGLISKVQDGDVIKLNIAEGTLELLLSGEELALRQAASYSLSEQHLGSGRELFSNMRKNLSPAIEGACSLFD